MALKGDREEVITDISYWMNEAAERGGIASLSTAGSGAALDQSKALVTYKSSLPSGALLVGLLLSDMVNIDQTRQHENFYKNEEVKGGKVCLLQKGWVTTNMIEAGVTVAANNTAYVANSGRVSNVDSGWAGGKVGRFGGTADEDGYVKLYVDLPN